MKFLKKKVLKCLWVSKFVDIGIFIPDTLLLVITEVVDVGILIPATLTILIVYDMLVEVDLGQKRKDNLTLEIW